MAWIDEDDGEVQGEQAYVLDVMNAGPGAASGRVAFNAEDAVQFAKYGDPVILVRIETSPEDLEAYTRALDALL